MARRSSPPEPDIILKQTQLDDLAERCREKGRFAYDTEFVMEDRYEPDVCLIQIATHDEVALIDPFAKLNLAPIWALISEPSVEKIVHAGQEDLGLCVQHTGKVARNVFDVQIAAGLMGPDYPLSLQKLVQLFLHIRLHKSKTLTDWRRRPLSAAQIRYAAEDVAYLPEAHEKILKSLKQLGRLDWARDEFKAFEDVTTYRRVEEEKLWRVKGAGSLESRQLTVLQDLLTWRDELAKTLDRPIRAVLKDYLLIEVAKFGINNASELRDLRGLNLSDKHVLALAKTVQNALAKPTSEWPQPKPREIEVPGEAVVMELATAVVRSYCAQHDLAYSLVATKSAIRELIRHQAGRDKQSGTPELLGGWRGHTVGAVLLEFLNGRRSLRVHRSGGDWGLDVLECEPKR